MPEPVKQALSTIEQLTSAQAVQAIVTVLVTLAVLFIVSQGHDAPQYLLFAWFTLLGLYFEVPGKPKLTAQ